MRELDVESGRDRTVVVLSPETGDQDAISLVKLVQIAWAGRLKILAAVVVSTAVAIAYALLATEWYRAETVLIPNEESVPNLAGGVGGLSGLSVFPGISLGSGSSEESVAVLTSRDFIREFIEDQQLMPVLFPDKWDEAAGRWVESDETLQPDVREGIEFFRANVLQVSTDARSQLVTLSIRWTDPGIAAEWARMLVERINSKMRSRASEAAERNIVYLQAELQKTNIAALRDSIGSLLQSELQKGMLADGNPEFAFRTVDAAQEPRLRVWPRRSLIAVMGVAIGAALGSLWVFVAFAMRDSAKLTSRQ